MDAPAADFSDTSSIDDAALARWDEAVAPASSSAPVETAATPAAPEETNSAEAKPADPPATETNSEPAVEPGPTTPEPTSFEKWVAKYGDPNKAADAAWEANNRLATMARELEELKASKAQPATNAEATVEQPAVQPAPSAEVAPVTVAPEQVEQWVNQQCVTDPAVLAWDSKVRSNNERLNVLNDPASPESVAAAAKEIEKLQYWLQLPQVAENEFEKATYQASLANMRAEYQARRLEAQSLDLENRDLRADYAARQNYYRTQITQHYESQARSQREQQEYQTQVTRHAAELEKAWPQALARAIKEHKIPESEVEDFKTDLRNIALASLEAGIRVEDLDGFMDREAKRLNERLDRAHRTKAAEYARLAEKRAAQPAPVPSVVPQVQPSQSGDPLADVYARAELAWKQLAG